MGSRATRFVGGALVAVTLVLAAGCGSDEKSPSEQACGSKDDLSDAVSKVADDVKDGDLDAAKDDLGDVTAAFSQLKADVSDLAEEQKQDLDAQLSTLETDAKALTSASSTDELKSDLDKVQADVKAIASSVGDALDCD